jgi:hypothetical protein
MNKLHIALAAALALGSQFAAAQATGPFEGGQAANAFALGSPIASTADRATVQAQGNEAARHLNSRSGQQNLTEQIIYARFTSTRSRDDVRAEALASGREVQAVEGGLSGYAVNRIATPLSATLASGAANPVQYASATGLPAAKDALRGRCRSQSINDRPTLNTVRGRL